MANELSLGLMDIPNYQSLMPSTGIMGIDSLASPLNAYAEYAMQDRFLKAVYRYYQLQNTGISITGVDEAYISTITQTLFAFTSQVAAASAFYNTDLSSTDKTKSDLAKANLVRALASTVLENTSAIANYYRYVLPDGISDAQLAGIKTVRAQIGVVTSIGFALLSAMGLTIAAIQLSAAYSAKDNDQIAIKTTTIVAQAAAFSMHIANLFNSLGGALAWAPTVTRGFQVASAVLGVVNGVASIVSLALLLNNSKLTDVQRHWLTAELVYDTWTAAAQIGFGITLGVNIAARLANVVLFTTLPLAGLILVGVMAAITPLQILQIHSQYVYADQLDFSNSKIAKYGYAGDKLLADLFREKSRYETKVLSMTAAFGTIGGIAAAMGAIPVAIFLGLAAFVVNVFEQDNFETIADKYAAIIQVKGGSLEYFAKELKAQYLKLINSRATQAYLRKIQTQFSVDSVVGIGSTLSGTTMTSLVLAAITKNSADMITAAAFVRRFDAGKVVVDDTISVNYKLGQINLGTGSAGATQAMVLINPLIAPGTENRSTAKTGKNSYYTSLNIVFAKNDQHPIWTIVDGASSTIMDLRGAVDQIKSTKDGTRDIGISIDAGLGDDTIIAGAASMTVTGGGGNDMVRYDGLNPKSSIIVTPTGTGFAVAKTIVGGSLYVETAETVTNGYGKRVDTVEYRSIVLQKNTATLYRTDTLMGVENIGGGLGNDSITGDQQANTLLGNGGDDILFGGDGNDTLVGGTGNDVVYGGQGDDWIGEDIDGSNGQIDGGTGNDMLDFSITDLSGLQVTVGVAVNLSTGLGLKRATGGMVQITGIENVIGTALDDQLIGDGGDNMLVGGAGNDALVGGDGNDTLLGGAGADTILGGAGDDVIGQDFGIDNDVIDGGVGNNTVDYSVTDLSTRHVDFGVIVNLALQTAQKVAVGVGVDSLTNIENVIGTALADRLTGDAGDNLFMGGAGNDVLNGADGNDILFGGVGTDRISGGAGDDRMMQDGGANNDVLDGGLGNDTVDYTLSTTAAAALGSTVGVQVNLATGVAQNWDAANVMVTAASLMLAKAVAAPAAAVPAAANNAAVDTLINIENVVGTDRADQITGDANANLIMGAGGNDVIDGAAGNDVLFGGVGADTIRGGAGDDVLMQDMDGANDLLDGGDGSDMADYSSTDLSQLGQSVGVIVNLVTGVAQKLASGGVDALKNIENVSGTALADVLTGDAGNNLLMGADGNDSLNGAAGNDMLQGGIGSDTVNGGSGDDMIVQDMDGVNDVLDGGDGSDTVDYSFTDLSQLGKTAGVNVNLVAGVAQKLASGGVDTLKNIENVVGTALADVLTGDANNNVLQGGAGSDIINGGAGDDVIVQDMNGGMDVLDGGDGSDTVDYSVTNLSALNLTRGVSVYLNTGLGVKWAGGTDTLKNIENVIGTALADVITGDASDNMLRGGAGADVVSGGAGNDYLWQDMDGANDQLDGGSGSDMVDYSITDLSALGQSVGVVVNLVTGVAQKKASGGVDTLKNIENVKGTALADAITGDAGNNLLVGAEGNDSLNGGAGDDMLQGGSGADSVNGGAGNDVIAQDMDGANDVLDGGDGTDTVDYRSTDLSGLNAQKGVNVNLLTGVAQKLASGGVDTLKNIENVIGTALADVLTGNAGSNLLQGGAGADTINGGGGNDLIVQDMDGANDQLDGGDAIDTVDYSTTDLSVFNALRGVTVNLATGVAQKLASGGVDTLKNIENVVGTALADVLTGDGGNNLLRGGAGADSINGGGGNDLIVQDMDGVNDQIDGGAGTDTVDYSITDVSKLGQSVGVIVNLVTGVAQKKASGGVDALKNIENVVGTALADTLTGDAGNNLLQGGLGADTINGGAGNDWLMQDMDGANDKLDGGDGSDTVDYGFTDLSGLNASRGVTVNLVTGVAQKLATGGVDTLKNIENVFGTALADVLTGDSGNNMLRGAAGADTINGGGGNDLIVQDMDGANDKLDGGDGLDTVDYSSTDLSQLGKTSGVNVNLVTGVAQKLASGGVDTLNNIENVVGTALADVITGNDGDNLLQGGAGADTINGGAGNDYLLQDMDGASDQLNGGDGNDTVDYSVTDLSQSGKTVGVNVNLVSGLGQKLASGNGVDTLKNIENVIGTALADVITGSADNNVLQGGLGADTINGGGGNDMIVQDMDGANDKLDGGDGIDTVDYSSTDLSKLGQSVGVNVNLVTGVAQKKASGGVDTLANIENIIGTALADVMTGDANNNLIRGGAGADVINGGAGNDYLIQDMDGVQDQLDGGDGMDTVDYSFSDLSKLGKTSGVNVNLVTGVAQKLASGGVDTLKNIENVVGTALADVLTGDAGNNMLQGGTGSDVVNGGAGDDYLIQDMDGVNDQVDGGDGSDTVDYSFTDLSTLGKTAGVSVNLATGVAQKLASGGVDTLKNIENVFGTALADVLTGDAGNNTLRGQAGADIINGGGGNDLIVQDMDGANDKLDGGDGIDTVDYSISDLSKLGQVVGVMVNLATGAAQKKASGGVDTLAHIENVVGTALADVLTGDAGNNMLQGGMGADTVNGGAGNDYLLQDMDGANDVLNGGDGTDTVDYSFTDLSKLGKTTGVIVNLVTGVGQKLASGGVDALKNIENVIGTALADVMTGDAGNNMLRGAAGADTVNGGAGNDWIVQDMDGANDKLDGGDGIDTVDYSVSDLSKLGKTAGVTVNLVTGVAQKLASGGVDTLKNIENVFGTALADVLTGDTGNNMLRGQAGADTINGGGGNDLIVQDMDGANDQLDGGDGIDTVDYSITDLSQSGKTAGVTVNLLTGVAQKLASGGVDALKNIENVVGTALADVLTGDASNNMLRAQAGADTINGGGGNDLIVQDMDGANDQLDGGDGMDTVDYSITDLSQSGKIAGVTVNLLMGVAQKLASGGVDALKNIENVVGTALADVITGDDGNNVLRAGAGADIVNGGGGDDVIAQDMDGANDQLDGGDANDTVDYSVSDLSALNVVRGVNVNLATGLAQKLASGGVDTLKNIENVIGTALADVLTGNAGDNALSGAEGNDVLDGGAGNDMLFGGAGADSVKGGSGDDTIGQDMAADNDQLDGGIGIDTVDYSLTDLSQSGKTNGVTVNLVTGVAQKLAAGNGVDTLANIENVTGTALADRLTGDAGANMLVGGAGNDTLDGAAGNDVLLGGAGTDSVNGGDGDDRVVQDMERVNDQLDGGAGNDTLDYSLTDLSTLNVLRGVNVNLSSGIANKWATNGTDAIKNFENVIGTALADQLTGDAGNNMLWGGVGDDLLSGAAGDDMLMGGAGNDQLYGQDGNDILFGGAGADTINGAAGDDLIEQDITADNDQIYGGDGIDTLDYSISDLSALGVTLGVNVNLATGVAQKLAAGGGVDSLYNIENVRATALADSITGNAADNALSGGAGNDVLNGGAGNDVLLGGAGTDIINGGVGDDVIGQDMEAVSDQLNGGDGNDTVDYSISDLSTLSVTAGVNVNLVTGLAQKLAVGGAVDKLTNIENVTGTALADQLTGNAADNQLMGGAGNDVLDGGAGNDVLLGGAGSDSVNGGAGNDLIEQDFQYVNDQLDGGDGVDTLDYGFSDLSALNVLRGVNVNLASGIANKWATNGIDTLKNFENVIGTALADQLTGDAGDNTLWGAAGDDLLSGAAGNDVLIGGVGNDQLYGQDGNDILFGGAGTDIINGGAGDDVIAQDMAAANDQLNGGDGVDMLDYSVTDLSALGVTVGVNVNLVTGVAQKLAAGVGFADTFTNIENVTGTALADVLIGNAGNNVLRGGAGADLVNGGAGNDVIVQDMDGSSDQLDGGDGLDMVDYSASDLSTLGKTVGVAVNLATGVAQKLASGNGVDTLKNIENVIGTALSDVLTGDTGNNMLRGGAGSDTINGGAGSDLIVQDMDGANDQLDGGDGLDLVDYSLSDLSKLGKTAGVIVNLATGVAQKLASGGTDTLKNIENVIGTALADVITGDAGNNLLQGGAGADIVNGGMGNDYLIQNMDGANDQLDGGDGNDTVDYSVSDLSALNATRGVTVNLVTGVAQKLASGGVDTLKNIENVIGTALADVITGDGGNNILQGGAGADIVNGGAGNDVIVQDMDASNDQLDGGDGLDMLDYSSADLSALSVTVGVNVNLATGLAQKLAIGSAVDILANIENVTGTALADQLTGNAGDNQLIGGAGNDILNGAGGNDILLGGTGSDIVNGGAGDDVLGQDMNGSNDHLDGGDGWDTVDYSVTDLSALNVAIGVNVNLATGLAQKLAAGAAVDTLANIENVTGTALADQLTGNSGDNQLIGGAGNDVLNGGDGNDVLLGGTGSDSVNGGAGNDLVVQDMQAGNDQLDGGDGVDTLDYSFSDLSALNALSGVNVNLASGITYKLATGGMDTLKNIENVIGTALADQLTGDGGNNTLWGAIGDDVLSGAAGNDVLMGGVGNDQLDGQDGDDILFGGAGADIINGGAGNDVIEQDMAAVNDQLNGGDGVDMLDYSVSDLSALGVTLGVNVNLVTGVALKLAAGVGVVDTFTNIENVTGTALADVLTGNASDNGLTGGAGNDLLDGGAGNDTLFGGAGTDNIKGGSGDDLIVQDMAANNDLLDGGDGTDTVDYSITDLSALKVTQGVNVNLSTGVAQKLATGGMDTLANIENVTGTALADVIIGNAGKNVFIGGAGNDMLSGGAGADTYLLGRGDGQDSIVESDYLAGNDASMNTIQYAQDVASNQLWFTRAGNDLQVSIVGTTDKVAVSNWYLGVAYQGEQFKAGDGKTLNYAQVDALVQAMAVLTPPAVGQTALSDAYQASLAPVLVACWH